MAKCLVSCFFWLTVCYLMIAACILEYMFITVTCCEETAKKLFEHFRGGWLCAHHCVCHPHHCLANSRTCRTLHLDFHGFPGPGNITNTIPGLSRRHGNPKHRDWKLAQSDAWSTQQYNMVKPILFVNVLSTVAVLYYILFCFGQR